MKTIMVSPFWYVTTIHPKGSKKRVFFGYTREQSIAKARAYLNRMCGEVYSESKGAA